MRKTLGNNGVKHKNLSMPDVYAYIDKGFTVTEAAEHFGVSASLLYKRHREYMKYCGSAEGITESIHYITSTGNVLPYRYSRKLAGRKRAKKQVDMTAVYNFLDAGHTVSDAAEHFGVSVSTLYRRHKEINE